MFTGIIEGSGRIADIRSAGQGSHMTIGTDLALDDVKIGDSIAVNGACLTVVRFDRTRFTVDVSPETLTKTTLRRKRIGDSVNLERALRLSDRLDGHLVSGHIDGMGELSERKASGNAVLMTFAIPETLSRYVVEKGSIAIDGVSLTINRRDRRSFEVSIIPHTAKETTLVRLKIGDAVNIETDMIGKYVERFVLNQNQGASEGKKDQASVSLKLLAENGFL
jgi:riboflavin synthase